MLESAVSSLRRASRSTGAHIWRDASRYLLKSRSRRVRVNVGKISRLTKDGDVVLVPGKVLGGGEVSHRVVVGAFLFSSSAVGKILKAGGETLTITELVKRHPSGRGVILIGG